MTPTTRTELMNIAKQAAAYIARLGGECDTFQIDSETLSVVIRYEVETGEDKDDCWWIEQETVNVERVYNEDGDNDTEAVEWLAKQLN